MLIDYKKHLNLEQYKVVTQGDGPALVLAGAGSGKTRTLVFRVAYLIEQGIEPQNIILVTFTNKAAKEMLDRVESLLGEKPRGMHGGTFHHIANLILRQHAPKLGYKNNFTIMDQEDSVSMIKNIMSELSLDTKGKNFPKPSVVLSLLSYARNTNAGIQETATEHYGYPMPVANQAEQIASRYEIKKKEVNGMDFDDLLTNWLKLLQDFPEVKNYYAKKFQYVLVDEYQDTNYIQAEIIKLLADHHKNVLVVGDDSQSIYSFRAADVRNILNFPNLFPQAKIFKIEKNYRSTPQILDLANEIIKKNLNQYQKDLSAERPSSLLPGLIPARDENGQTVKVLKRVMELYRSGANYGDMAVLYRANFQSASLQLELSKNNIPYIIRGGMRYFEQAHIKDLTAYLKIMANLRDELAWQRVLLKQEGIGLKGAMKIWKMIAELKDLHEAAKFDYGLSGKAGLSMDKLKFVLKNLASMKTGNLAEAVDLIIEAGYSEYLRNSYENYKDRLDDLRQFADFASKYQSLDELLADVALSENFDRAESGSQNAVVLSTIHQAKGLEWPYVFIIGLRDGHFPHQRCMENTKDLEEERRLFYVAVTRAKDELNMYYPVKSFSYKYGEMRSEPSMFLREIDQSKFTVERSNSYFDNDQQDFYDDEEKVIYYD